MRARGTRQVPGHHSERDGDEQAEAAGSPDNANLLAAISAYPALTPAQAARCTALNCTLTSCSHVPNEQACPSPVNGCHVG